MAPLVAEPENTSDLSAAKVLEYLDQGPALLILHSNADLDCVGSALALKQVYPDSQMTAPMGVSGAGKLLLERLGLEPLSEQWPGPETYQTVVVLDTGNPSLVELPEKVERLMIIDHHQSLAGWPAETMIHCNAEHTSCAEVVLDLLELKGVELDPLTCQLLMAGLVADTAHFRHATVQTMQNFTRLLELHDQRPGDILDLLRSDFHRDLSRRIAQLKGAQRIKVVREGDHLIATAQSGSFESSTAHALLGLGADVAFVASQKKNFVRLSARARANMVEKGLNLGELLYELGEQTGTEGGGHPGAAALSGDGEAEALLHLSAQATRRSLM